MIFYIIEKIFIEGYENRLVELLSVIIIPAFYLREFICISTEQDTELARPAVIILSSTRIFEIVAV